MLTLRVSVHRMKNARQALRYLLWWWRMNCVTGRIDLSVSLERGTGQWENKTQWKERKDSNKRKLGKISYSSLDLFIMMNGCVSWRFQLLETILQWTQGGMHVCACACVQAVITSSHKEKLLKCWFPLTAKMKHWNSVHNFRYLCVCARTRMCTHVVCVYVWNILTSIWQFSKQLQLSKVSHFYKSWKLRFCVTFCNSRHSH